MVMAFCLVLFQFSTSLYAADVVGDFEPDLQLQGVSSGNAGVVRVRLAVTNKVSDIAESRLHDEALNALRFSIPPAEIELMEVVQCFEVRLRRSFTALAFTISSLDEIEVDSLMVLVGNMIASEQFVQSLLSAGLELQLDDTTLEYTPTTEVTSTPVRGSHENAALEPLSHLPAVLLDVQTVQPGAEVVEVSWVVTKTTTKGQDTTLLQRLILLVLALGCLQVAAVVFGLWSFMQYRLGQTPSYMYSTC